MNWEGIYLMQFIFQNYGHYLNESRQLIISRLTNSIQMFVILEIYQFLIVSQEIAKEHWKKMCRNITASICDFVC